MQKTKRVSPVMAPTLLPQENFQAEAKGGNKTQSIKTKAAMVHTPVSQKEETCTERET